MLHFPCIKNREKKEVLIVSTGFFRHHGDTNSGFIRCAHKLQKGIFAAPAWEIGRSYSMTHFSSARFCLLQYCQPSPCIPVQMAINVRSCHCHQYRNPRSRHALVFKDGLRRQDSSTFCGYADTSQASVVIAGRFFAPAARCSTAL